MSPLTLVIEVVLAIMLAACLFYFWRLDKKLSELRSGQDGALMLTGMPLQRFPFTVTKVTPIATPEDGRNFFRVEGRLAPEHEAALRPGMEGIAKVHAGTRSLAWIWSHDVIEWLRLALWRWSP